MTAAGEPLDLEAAEARLTAAINGKPEHLFDAESRRLLLDGLQLVAEVRRQRAQIEHLHVMAGRLPNGDGCAYAGAYGMEDWHEHDHDACLDAVADDQDETTTLADRLASGGAL